MGELFRSAMSYLSSGIDTAAAGGLVGGSAVGGSPGGGSTDHNLVGQTVEVGGLKLRIRTLIAEGGFALVFSATDGEGNWYALKRLLAADREQSDTILKEIRFLRQLTGGPSVIRYVQAASLSPQESGHGRAEFLLLTELCSGGPVITALQSHTLNPSHVVRIFHSACNAVKHMHAQTPPVTHRDLKIENLLLDTAGFVKLCDFGSAMTEIYNVDSSWSAAQRSRVEDEMTRNTTPMYRAPEMVDLYLDYPIGPPLDVWALGCVLYYLCYRSHPFEDSAKLRILNAKYTPFPEHETPFTVFHPLIEWCLKIDPRERPTVAELVDRLEAVAVALECDLTLPLIDLLPPRLAARQGAVSPNRRPTRTRTPPPSVGASGGAAPPPRPPPPSRSSPVPPSAAVGAGATTESSGGALFGSIRGQAGSLFKNLKDSSAKVVQSVQAGIGGRGADVCYVTSRLVMAPLSVDGLPEAIATPAEDALRGCLELRHPGRYAVYNLNNRRLKGDYGGRASEVPLRIADRRPPALQTLFLLCKNMSLWLRQHNSNLCVVTGDEESCLVVCAAVLVYCRLVERPLAAVEYVLAKRGNAPVPLQPSIHRYLDYVHGVAQRTLKLHNRAVTITALRVEPIPLFNRARNGCRPFAEVWQGQERILSTSQEYESIRPYEVGAGSKTIDIPLGVSVLGDCSLAVFHARSTLGAKVQGRMTSIPILRVNFHTGAIVDPSSTSFVDFHCGDLDDLAPIDERWKYPEPFRVTIAVRISEQDRPFPSGEPPAYWSYDAAGITPRLLVSDKQEKGSCNDESEELIHQHLGIPPAAPSSPARSVSPSPAELSASVEERKPPARPAKQPTTTTTADEGNFFDSLQWAAAHEDTVSQDGSKTHLNEQQPSQSATSATPSNGAAALPKVLDTEEAYERMYGIRVSSGVPDEPEPPQTSEPTTADLLNFSGTSSHAAPSVPSATVPDILSADPFDPFAQFEQQQQTAAPAATGANGMMDLFADFTNLSTNNNTVVQPAATTASNGHPPVPSSASGDGMADLLQDWGDTILKSAHATPPLRASPLLTASLQAAGLPRNVSAPAFPQATARPHPPTVPADPFAGLVGGSRPTTPLLQQPPPPPMSGSVSSGRLSGAATTPTHPRPNYSRSIFEANNTGVGAAPMGINPKVVEGAFDDILSSAHGFASAKSKEPRTIDELKRKVDIEGLSPVEIKIRDWTKGKERNIRALLGSVHEVMWEEVASKWESVTMAQLLTPAQVKKYYYKACLVVHPDKQTGTPNEELCRAIFTELNDAWNDFQQAGEPSL